MRRTEFLITELRQSTDNVDTNGVKDAEIIGYYNAGQRLIQNIIFKANPKADLFKEVIVYASISTGIYDLPSNCFAENAISLVETKNGIDTVNDGYRPLDRVDKSEASNVCGYYTEDKKLIITGVNSTNSVRVTYFKALPKMDKRWGKVSALTSGVSLTIDPASYDVNYSTVDDQVTVVDKFGAQILPGIFVDSYAANVMATTNALTGVTTANYLCMGKDSVNASLLPDACETYLQDYVRQRVYTRNVYNDANKQVYFTDKQEADIADLFKNNQKDVLYPPITDTTMLEW